MNYYDISNEFDKDKINQFIKSNTLKINTIENLLVEHFLIKLINQYLILN